MRAVDDLHVAEAMTFRIANGPISRLVDRNVNSDDDADSARRIVSGIDGINVGNNSAVPRFYSQLHPACNPGGHTVSQDHPIVSQRLARTFLGTQDPLDFFRSWKTPQERYRPKYPSTESGKA
ncbi:MAG: hypothetical protein E5V60_01150 [Mesorhizobium sp.]|uniref:hypothetical protein n=1 Tax=Mesorhizobium sp. M4A.F.Ca.ET.090.04.2.1 TaxID=2496663 RepID=UPI000FCBB581|nr:hypothetical protein [Mesorhizobium sp. M4A.F.Ca.ET.090.04.2.1]RVC47456.1 hypothetical protein EN781_01005 [Mesorhizobium sp. M4A.F.Ca.ET.090.04.2.1]TIW69327.1 MAG: hypothetical protein E5V60_01150 [Mesorhizobium sp.]